MMEMVDPAATTDNVGGGMCWHRAWKLFAAKLWSKAVKVGRQGKKLGEDDPRRIIHSFKVGLAIVLVSAFYYFDPLYEGFGVSAMWAVMTVVVIFEFSVGATVGKGVNRCWATLVAGGLGVGAHRLASFAGETCEPILLGVFVFIVATMVTFIRFFPKVKARYDYGLLILILTFSLVSVSGYRDDEVLLMANKRLSTIFIGGATTMMICLFICPVWAGDDLHNLVAINMEKLGCFLEESGNEYLKRASSSRDSKETTIGGYRSVVDSKSTEEGLANSAKWEPRHGRFRYRHPWDQYIKIGSLTRECAYKIDALNAYRNSDLKAPVQVREKYQEWCQTISKECSCALKELAIAIKTMTKPYSVDRHIENSKLAAKKLKSMLKTGLWLNIELMEVIPAATVASLLTEIVHGIDEIKKSVNELASLAEFKSIETSVVERKLTCQRKLSSNPSSQDADHVIIIGHLASSTAE